MGRRLENNTIQTSHSSVGKVTEIQAYLIRERYNPLSTKSSLRISVKRSSPVSRIYANFLSLYYSYFSVKRTLHAENLQDLIPLSCITQEVHSYYCLNSRIYEFQGRTNRIIKFLCQSSYMAPFKRLFLFGPCINLNNLMIDPDRSSRHDNLCLIFSYCRVERVVMLFFFFCLYLVEHF